MSSKSKSLVQRTYKALMLDLDGTTVRSGRGELPSERVKEAISKAQQKLHVGLATGRILPEAKYIIEFLNLFSPCVISGGAEIYDPVKRKIINEIAINNKQIKQFVDLAKGYSDTIFLFNGDIDFIFKKDGIPKKVLTSAVLGLTMEKADEIIAKSRYLNALALHKVASWKFPDTFDVLVNDVQATKQHGIYEVAKILGINTHEIIGVGDSYNDFPLLMACGLRIAMGNAVPELKEIADYVAPSVEDDGVADVIEKYILNSEL